MKRVIWIILDSVGMGEQPDAARFGDVGTHTLAHVWEYNNGLKIPISSAISFRISEPVSTTKIILLIFFLPSILIPSLRIIF